MAWMIVMQAVSLVAQHSLQLKARGGQRKFVFDCIERDHIGTVEHHIPFLESLPPGARRMQRM